MSGGRLAVTVDGVALPEDEARAFWDRFSRHMDEHPGDLAGFAQNEGFASVHPEPQRGVAVLVVSRSATQKPYGSPAARSTGGSPSAQNGTGARRHKRR